MTFDSAGLPVGTYTGQLCIRSNDPDNGPGNETNLVVVPVTLTVPPPTAVTLSDLAASSEQAQAPLPVSGLPLAALPAVVSLAWARPTCCAARNNDLRQTCEVTGNLAGLPLLMALNWAQSL